MEGRRDLARSRRHEASIQLLAVAGNVLVIHVLSRAAYLPANLLLATCSVLIARYAGATASELGLGRDALNRGIRLGLMASAAVLAIVILGVLDSARPLFADTRALAPQGRTVLFESLVRIPFGTVLAEEVLFRGALLGLALRRLSPTRAMAYNALLFGFWHVLPAIVSIGTQTSELIPRTPAGTILVISATVVATGLGGICLAMLRLRSGSIVAPVLTHTTLNVVAFWAARFAAG